MTARPAIRAALAGDAPAIHALHTRAVRTSCAAAYAPEVIDGWLKGRQADRYLPAIEAGRMFVAEQDGAIAGFCEATAGEVIALFVDPASGSSGVGRALLAHAMTIAAADGRAVRLESTLNAVGFYERAGFVRRGAGTIRRNDVEVPVVFMEMSHRGR